MASLALGVRFNPSAGGTTDFVYASTVTGYRVATSVLVNSKVYRYRAESADLSQWEYGTAIWSSTTSTLSRNTITDSSNAGAKVNFTVAPQVAITIDVPDVLGFDDAMSLTTTQQAQARSNIGVGTGAAAAKSDQQAGTSSVLAVTPLHQQDHDSSAKAWVKFVGSTGVISASYNIASVSRAGTGTYTVTFTTAFATADYIAHVTTINSANNTFGEINSSIVNAGSIGIFAINQAGGAVADPVAVMAVFYGRQ